MEFYSALTGCSQLIGGDDTFARQLATHLTEVHFIPDQEIMRELSLSPHIFIVNRGKVIISKDGKTLTSLTKVRIYENIINLLTTTVGATLRKSLLANGINYFAASRT